MTGLAKLIDSMTFDDILLLLELPEWVRLIAAAHKNFRKITLSPGETEKCIYDYTDTAGEYNGWATVDGTWNVQFYTNWGGNHKTVRINLLDPKGILICLIETKEPDDDGHHDLIRFLKEMANK